MKAQLKLALKVLARRKVFTAISLFGISLTLAVMMVVAAMLDNFLTPAAPQSRFDRALVVGRIAQYGREGTMTTYPGYGFLDRFVRTLPNTENVTVFSSLQSTALYSGGQRIDTMVKRTDGAFWQILDFDFVEGAPYSAADDAAGRHVAVINDDVRRKLFGDGPAVGRTLVLDGREFRVVGVVKRVPFARLSAYSQLWVPIGTMKSSEYRNQMTGSFEAVVLLRDRSDIPAVKRAFASRMPQVPLTDPKRFHSFKAAIDTPVEAFARLTVGRNRPEATGVTSTAGTVLVILALVFMALPALNLITLNLSRILERAPEIGVRRAFGARRGALVRQLVLENVLVTVIGGVAGFALAAIFLPLLGRIAPAPDLSFSLNVRVFAWGMALAIVFGVLSGVYPAWRMSRLHPVNALRGGAQ